MAAGVRGDVSSTVKTKKKCCSDAPRCKRCPVVWERLERDGLAERVDKRVYRPLGALPKRALKAARAR